MGWCKIAKGEGVLRACAVLLLVVAAIVMGSDRETKVVFGLIRKTATYKAAEAPKILIWVDSIVAAYNLLQLIRFFVKSPLLRMESKRSYVTLAWVSFLLDQVGAYGVVGSTLSSGEVGVLALTGEKGFQWMKLCNRFTRFCVQFGGALLVGFFAFLVLALISFISAFNLFSLYSPKHFLHLKPTPSQPPFTS